ncbi:MAG: S8 family serine peptidase, partial [Actinomycetota bacterium]
MSVVNCSRWLLLGVLTLAAMSPLEAESAPQPEVVPGQIVVGFRAPAALQAASLDASRGMAQVLGHQPRLRAARMRLRPGVSLTAMRERLARRSDVEYVEPLYIRRAVSTPNDTAYANQWALPKIDADEAWGVWQPQSQVKIAIIDTGVDLTHPDLASVLARDGSGAVVSFNAQTNSTAPGAANDDNGHGTHCAGIAAGQINNARGIAGVGGWNPSVPGSNGYIKLLPVKVLDADGSGTDADVAEGIIWAADQGARVISMSLGGAGASTTLTNATNYARSKGCVVIGAAGNDGVSTKFYPAANTGVVSVGATDSSDRLASFSNWGTWVKVAAPGVDIYATYPGGRYTWMSGTSMAAPHVAGQAAAILAQNPNLANTAVENAILDNADPYQDFNGRLLATGAGRINVRRSLEAVGGGPVSVASIVISPSAVTGGATATGTVTLTGTAPTGGAAVELASDLASASVPSTVHVLAGQLTASFQVTTIPGGAASTATILATVGADARTATLQIRPPTPSTLTLSPTAVNSGESTAGTVLLSGPAPAGGAVVALASGSSVATVPPAVTVAAGATS